MSDLVLEFQKDGATYEDCGRINGGKYWYAREFMRMLGYESYQPFRQAINRAIATCSTLGISVTDNFAQCESVDVHNGTSVPDYKLSRFACYLVAMNGDVKKAAVAEAQKYFAGLAEAARQYIQAAQDVERVQIRDDISEREKGLNSTAKRAGVTDFGLFQNAGYLGMYNMNLNKLKEMKGLPDGRTLLDFMDKRELAGNLFRLTETEAKLQTQGVFGQRPAEQVAKQVGQQVRKMMIDNTGTAPERLPLVSDIKGVRKGLKQTAKELAKMDRPKQSRALPPKPQPSNS